MTPKEPSYRVEKEGKKSGGEVEVEERFFRKRAQRTLSLALVSLRAPLLRREARSAASTCPSSEKRGKVSGHHLPNYAFDGGDGLERRLWSRPPSKPELPKTECFERQSLPWDLQSGHGCVIHNTLFATCLPYTFRLTIDLAQTVLEQGPTRG